MDWCVQCNKAVLKHSNGTCIYCGFYLGNNVSSIMRGQMWRMANAKSSNGDN